MFNKTLLGGLLCLSLTSCSTLNKMAVNSSSDLLYKASSAVQSEANLEMVRLSLPGNLTLIEGLLSASKNNQEILATLTKGYVGYAFSINETDFVTDELENKNIESNKILALKNYTKGFNYGLRYLATKDISFSELKSKMGDNASIMHIFDKRLANSKMDLETLMFTAQALGAMINLQKDNIGLVAELPLVKSMFDWVCMKDPSIAYGTCDVFFGTYEAGRPKMLGGNPEKGKEFFEKAIAKHPHNWLIRTSYIQYYLIPQGDEEGFKNQMDFMKNSEKEFNEFYIYRPDVLNPEWAKEEGMRFFQAIAIKRYQILEKFKKQLF